MSLHSNPFVRGAALLGAALIVFGVAAQQPPRPASGAPLRIGLSLGLSGTYKEIAALQEKAYRLWAQHTNEQGGLAGRRVDLIVRDDQSDPAVAKRIYEDFVKRDKLDFVFSPYSSAITSAVAPVTEAHGYPMIAAGAASDELWQRGYKHLVAIVPPAGRYAIGFLAILAENGIRELAIVYSDDAFSVSLAEGAKRWLVEYGLKLTSYQKIAKGEAVLDTEARSAQASGAKALLMAGHFDESVRMRRSLTRIGWQPRAYYASVGPALDAFATAVGADAEGTFSTSVWEARQDLKLPGAAQFLHDFSKAYGETPSYQAAQAYAAGQILTRAVEKAGRVDRAAVREALFELDTNVLIGRYAVDRSGVQTKRFPLIVQWHHGRREIVWPPELKTAAPSITR